MARSVPSSDNPLRIGVESFQARQEAGEVAIVLDVRGPRDWEQSGARFLPLRAYPELRMDPRWPKDRLILAFCAWPQDATRAHVALQLANGASRKPMPCSMVSVRGNGPVFRWNRWCPRWWGERGDQR